MADINYKISEQGSKEVQSAFNKINEGVKQSSSLMNDLKSAAGTVGIAFGTVELLNFGKEAVTAAANFQELRENFKGTEQTLQSFRTATLGTVGDASLVRLSNQAYDLGITLDQQAQFFAAAKIAADKYGTTVEEGMGKVIRATEGNKKALMTLGIEKTQYTKILAETIREMVAEGAEMDAETQKEAQVQAVLKLTGNSLEQLASKLKSNKDAIESASASWENLKIAIGSLITSPIVGFLDKITQAAKGWATILNGRPQVGISEEGKAGFTSTLKGMGKDELLKYWQIENEKYSISVNEAKKLEDEFNKLPYVDESSAAIPGRIKQLKDEANVYHQQLDLIDQAINSVDKVKEKWVEAGATIKDIKDHIASLKLSEDSMVPNSAKVKKAEAEIKRLTAKLPKEDKDTEAEDRKNYETKYAELLAQQVADQYDRAIAIAKAKTDELRKIYKGYFDKGSISKDELNKINGVIEGAFSREQSDIKNKKIIADAKPENDYTYNYVIKYFEVQKEYEDKLSDYKIQSIQNQYDRAIKLAENERDDLIKKYDDFYKHDLISFDQLKTIKDELNADSQRKTLAIEQQRYQQELSNINEIGNALQSAFNRSGDTFLSKLGEALQIALKIASAMDKIDSNSSTMDSGIFPGIIQGLGFLTSLSVQTGKESAPTPMQTIFNQQIQQIQPVRESTHTYINERGTLNSSKQEPMQTIVQNINIGGNTVARLYVEGRNLATRLRYVNN